MDSKKINLFKKINLITQMHAKQMDAFASLNLNLSNSLEFIV